MWHHCTHLLPRLELQPIARPTRHQSHLLALPDTQRQNEYLTSNESEDREDERADGRFWWCVGGLRVIGRGGLFERFECCIDDVSIVQRIKHERRKIRTGQDVPRSLPRTRQQHPHNPHREYLDSGTGHVKHECLHREGFRGTESGERIINIRGRGESKTMSGARGEKDESRRGTYDSATSHAFFIFKSFARSTLARIIACWSPAPSPRAFFPLPCDTKKGASAVSRREEMVRAYLSDRCLC